MTDNNSARVELLRSALKEFGEHKAGCLTGVRLGYDCTCGWAATLRGLHHPPATQPEALGEDDPAAYLREMSTAYLFRAETCSDDMVDEFTSTAEYYKAAAEEIDPVVKRMTNRIATLTAERDALEESLDEQVESNLQFADEYDKIFAQLTTARQTIEAQKEALVAFVGNCDGGRITGKMRRTIYPPSEKVLDKAIRAIALTETKP
jgi:hypothetical protein